MRDPARGEGGLSCFMLLPGVPRNP